MSQIFLLVVIVALVVWLVRPRTRPSPDAALEEVDQDELDAAEREVRDLDLHQRPEDGFEGDDWGPGAGGRR